jgi:hypothetical protein
MIDGSWRPYVALELSTSRGRNYRSVLETYHTITQTTISDSPTLGPALLLRPLVPCEPFLERCPIRLSVFQQCRQLMLLSGPAKSSSDVLRDRNIRKQKTSKEDMRRTL